MTNVHIRGLGDAVVERIDAEASELGLSRKEFLRPNLKRATAFANAETALTEADWDRSAATFGDLTDAEAMDAAWR